MNQTLSGPGSYIPIPPLHPDDAHDAPLAVCGLAHDREDARTILEALGILPVLQQARSAA